MSNIQNAIKEIELLEVTSNFLNLSEEQKVNIAIEIFINNDIPLKYLLKGIKEKNIENDGYIFE